MDKRILPIPSWKPRAASAGVPPGALLLLLIAVLAAGCHTAPPAAADFSMPGWRVHQGQAVWKPSANRPALAGDLLLATNVNGDFFIQFSKIPFPLATAQLSGDRWRIDFGADKFSRQGRGAPPDRFAWFQLPRALLNAGIGADWSCAQPAPQSWRLENSRTGEILEGVLFP